MKNLIEPLTDSITKSNTTELKGNLNFNYSQTELSPKFSRQAVHISRTLNNFQNDSCQLIAD